MALIKALAVGLVAFLVVSIFIGPQLAYAAAGLSVVVAFVAFKGTKTVARAAGSITSKVEATAREAASEFKAGRDSLAGGKADDNRTAE